ncbi:MAG: 50S ribosomal protein L10 [Candidatus Aenigmatarchaeota archaeon]|nr:MAG: 50S ribosomal protein L10 [Candidatus Aenigmarchaeota archaeon]
MVSEKKKKLLKEVIEEMKKYPVIGIIDMFKLPASQLHEIRNKLRGKAKIRMVKKRLIYLALRDAGLSNLEGLKDYIQGQPALLFSSENPFMLAKIINESKTSAFIKEGDTAPEDIVVRAGPTSLSAGPVIGELQRVRIPAAVEGEKIVIREDVTVAKKGDVISKELADVLMKLDIKPMEIGLNLLAAWENGLIYSKDILFIPPEKYIDDLKDAYSKAFNLAVAINYVTPENIKTLLSLAYQKANNLAVNAGVVTKDTIGILLSKADAEAKALKSLIG